MVQYHIDKSSLVLPLLGATMFVVIGGLMVAGIIGPAEDAAEVDRLAGIVLGGITIAFFGGIMLIALRFLLASDEPVIRIDEAGFYDRRACTHPIPWSAIHGARIFQGKTLYAFPQRFISLQVDQPEIYQRPGIGRYFPRLKQHLEQLYDEPGLSISTTLLGKSPESVLAAIRAESKGQVDIPL